MAAMPGQPPMIPGPPQMGPGEGGGDDVAPAAQLLPIVAMLAQQQQAAMAQQQQQEMMLKEAMRQQILRMVSMMAVPNPAGVAARTEPMPMNMSPADAGPEMGSEEPMQEDMGAEEMM